MNPDDAVPITVEAMPDPTWTDLAPMLPLVGQAPWVIVVWLGYQLARRALRDLCQAVPQALDVARSLSASVAKIADRGIVIRHHERDDEDDQ